MSDLLFDKLLYTDRLTASGIPEVQARAHADAMQEALRESVATKNDLNRMETALRSELLALKLELTVRMGVIGAAVVAILTSIKFFA